MIFLKEFTKGIGLFFSSISFIFSNRLGKYLLYPLLVWIVLFSCSFFLIDSVSAAVGAYFDTLGSKISLPESLASIQTFVSNYLGAVLSFIAKIFMWWITGTVIKYFSLILLSPVLALLSEAVEEKISGNVYPFQFRQFAKDVFRGIAFALRSMFIEFLLIVIGWIICLIIPIAWIIVTPLLFLIGWYFMGLSMMDYSCERHKMSIKESLIFLRKHKGMLCGIGLCYSFFLFMGNPFSAFTSLWFIFLIIKMAVGLIFFSFVPVLASIASTRAFLEFRKIEEKI